MWMTEEEAFIAHQTDELVDIFVAEPLSEVEAILFATDPAAALEDFADAYDYITSANIGEALHALREGHEEAIARGKTTFYGYDDEDQGSN